MGGYSYSNVVTTKTTTRIRTSYDETDPLLGGSSTARSSSSNWSSDANYGSSSNSNYGGSSNYYSYSRPSPVYGDTCAEHSHKRNREATTFLIGATICFALGMYFLAVCVKSLNPKEPPICVPPPYERVGLSGLDAPWPGSMYIITEADSTNALTYDGRGGVRMAEYQKDDTSQIWTCHESDGWLAFAQDPSAGSTVYLGYRAWPQPATLCASANSAKFNEQFDVRSRPDGGFQLRVRNGYGLEPLGRDRGTLSRVRQSDVWWRFSKVQHPREYLTSFNF